MTSEPRSTTLIPYTTLFRSAALTGRSHDFHPRLGPPAILVVLDPEVVAASGQGRLVHGGLVGGPSLDHQLPIHPDPDPVVADGTEPIAARRQIDRRAGLESPLLDRQLGNPGAIPLIVEP